MLLCMIDSATFDRLDLPAATHIELITGNRLMPRRAGLDVDLLEENSKLRPNWRRGGSVHHLGKAVLVAYGSRVLDLGHGAVARDDAFGVPPAELRDITMSG